ncbi:MAG: hypothetical protein WCR51_05450 [Planctomycetia bacterium]
MPPAARLAASVLIAVYLAAVILPPLAGPPPASALANRLLQPFRPLVGLVYLGHGYRFFAPDPGPGHSIRWTVERADGSRLSGSLPDRDTDWPRLLYHRRFMIAEKIAPLVPPADAPAEVRRGARAEWLPLVKGVAGQLLARHGGTRVELALVEHYLPGPEELIAAAEGRAGERSPTAPAQAPDMADLVTPLGTYAIAGEGRKP